MGSIVVVSVRIDEVSYVTYQSDCILVSCEKVALL